VCSFCQKPESSVSTLVASPSDYPRVYICNECIAVCASVLEDGGEGLTANVGTPVRLADAHPFLSHPLASSLCAAIEQWIRRESLGRDAAQELGEVRKIAMEMMKE
jgi:ATP-dependent protease Clp ATPase subunit